MDTQITLDMIFGVGMALFGWLAREMWVSVKELRADIALLRQEVPRNYVAKEDYRADIKDIKISLDKILDRLDKKQDKHAVCHTD